MDHCTGYGACRQGRAPCKTAWACNVKTKSGGETVDNGLPIQMHEGTLDEPIRKWNVIASVSWIGIVLAVLGGLLWGLWSTP